MSEQNIVDDARVRRIVNAAITAVPDQPNDNDQRAEVAFDTVRTMFDNDRIMSASPVLAGDPTVDTVGVAFRALQRLRREERPQDFDLAAAEHYAYARFLGGFTGDPVVKLAPSGYAAKKKLYFMLGWEEKLRTTPNNPALPPNAKVVEWGRRGAADGLDDFSRTRPGESQSIGNALGPLREQAYR